MDPYLLVCPACGGTNRLPRSRPASAARCGRCKASLFDGHPSSLDAAAFDRHLTTDGIPLLVDFWAAWCGPCKTMAPVFEAAAKVFEPRVRFAKLDTDAVPEIAQRYGIRSIPTLVLFDQGRERARQAGALSPSQLRQWLESQLPAA